MSTTLTAITLANSTIVINSMALLVTANGCRYFPGLIPINLTGIYRNQVHGSRNYTPISKLGPNPRTELITQTLSQTDR